jgi:hypothetical protein
MIPDRARDMINRTPEVCSCPCHHHNGMLHLIPCCDPCPTCGVLIRIGFHERHVERCNRDTTAYVMD